MGRHRQCIDGSEVRKFWAGVRWNQKGADGKEDSQQDCDVGGEPSTKKGVKDRPTWISGSIAFVIAVRCWFHYEFPAVSRTFPVHAKKACNR